MMRIEEEVEVSSLVCPFKTNERIQEMTLTHYPWRLVLKDELLSFRGKEAQLMFEKPLSEVDEAWWEPSKVLNLRIEGEHYTFAFVSPGFHRAAVWMRGGLFSWLPFFWVTKKTTRWENERRAEANKWRTIFPVTDGKHYQPPSPSPES